MLSAFKKPNRNLQKHRIQLALYASSSYRQEISCVLKSNNQIYREVNSTCKNPNQISIDSRSCNLENKGSKNTPPVNHHHTPYPLLLEVQQNKQFLPESQNQKKMQLSSKSQQTNPSLSRKNFQKLTTDGIFNKT